MKPTTKKQLFHARIHDESFWTQCGLLTDSVDSVWTPDTEDASKFLRRKDGCHLCKAELKAVTHAEPASIGG